MLTKKIKKSLKNVENKWGGVKFIKEMILMKIFSRFKARKSIITALLISSFLSSRIGFGEETNKPLSDEEKTKVEEVIKQLGIERAKTLFDLLIKKNETDKVREIIKKINEVEGTDEEKKVKKEDIIEKGEGPFSSNILKDIKDTENNSIVRIYRSGVIEIGKGASMINNVALNNDGILIGTDAKVDGYLGHPGSIAIGKSAYAETFFGVREQILNFKRTTFNKTGYNAAYPYDIDKIDTPIAIGRNSYASSGSVVLGQHTYTGKIGDINIESMKDGASNRVKGIGIYSTVVGTNSFANGTLSTLSGAYSIMTSQYEGEDNEGVNLGKGVANHNLNLGALINGSLNSIESNVGDNGAEINKYSGIANSVVGFANRANNSNGTMIFGAGNEITNSTDEIGNYDVCGQDVEKYPNSVKELAENLRKQYSDGNVGGSTLVFGSGNKVDYAKYANITGSKNKVTGTKDKKSENNIVSGNDNEIVEASNNIVYGTKYRIKKKSPQTQTRSTQDTGTQTEDPNGNILFGHNDEYVDITVKNTVAIGDNITPNLNNSVYLGTNSTEAKDDNTLWRKENRDQSYKEYAGFNNIGGIVTVGNNTLTRVIQNVAPGLISATSTDAINGSQLYKYVAKQYINVKAGDKIINVKLGDTLELKGNGIDISVDDKQPQTTQSNTTPQPAPSTSQEHTATFEAKGNVGGSDTFGYKYRDDKGNETELKEGPDGKLYTNEFIQNNEYKNNKWVKKGSTEDSILKDNQYDKKDEKVILSTKYGKIITDVADGIKAKDAVNVSQLNAVRTKVEKNTSDIQQLQKDVKEVDKKSDLALGGVSNAVAMANLPQVMGDKKFNLAASYGYYGGSHAIAVGFSGTNDKQNFIYKLSGSVNNKGNLAFGIGAGVMLGEVNNKDKKIEDLTKENKEIKENLRNQSAEIQELKEIVRRLMKK